MVLLTHFYQCESGKPLQSNEQTAVFQQWGIVWLFKPTEREGEYLMIHFWVEYHFNNLRTLELMRMRPVGLLPDMLCRKRKRKTRSKTCLLNVSEMDIIVISGISVPQIHYSVAVNLIKYWTCTDGALDLVWVPCIVCTVYTQQQLMHVFVCIWTCSAWVCLRVTVWSWRMAFSVDGEDTFSCMCEHAFLCARFMACNHSMMHMMTDEGNLFVCCTPRSDRPSYSNKPLCRRHCETSTACAECIARMSLWLCESSPLLYDTHWTGQTVQWHK